MVKRPTVIATPSGCSPDFTADVRVRSVCVPSWTSCCARTVGRRSTFCAGVVTDSSFVPDASLKSEP